MQGPAATATDFQRAQARSELHCRILAIGGPAAGKTSMVAGRLERLVSAGLPAESILSVSPTAEAAAQQRALLAERCANRVVGTLRVVALAEVAAGAVRRHWTRFGYPSEPASITPTIRTAIVRELFLDGEDLGWGRAPEIARHVAFLRTITRALEVSDAEAYGLDEERFALFERRYREALRQNSAFDQSSAFANATRLYVDGTADTDTIEHLLADDADTYSAGALEYLCVLGSGASSVVATASADVPGSVDSIDLAALLDCEPLLFPALDQESSPLDQTVVSRRPAVQWSHQQTGIEQLEVMTQQLMTLRRSGVRWDEVTVIAIDDGAAARIVDACHRSRIPTHSFLPHPWVSHLDRLLAAAAGEAADALGSLEVLASAVGSGLVDLDPGLTAGIFRDAHNSDDPVGQLIVLARSARGDARRLAPVVDCFQRAARAASQGRDVAAVAWMLWRGMPIAARLAALRARSAADREMIVGARSVASWHRELRSAVALEPGLTAQKWCSVRRFETGCSASGEASAGLTGSSVHVRRLEERTAPVGRHLVVPLFGSHNRVFSADELAHLRHAMIFAQDSIRILGSGAPELSPTALSQDRPLIDDKKLSESDATVLLRAVGSATTPLDDQIVIAAALAEIDIDVPWASSDLRTGPVFSPLSDVSPALNGSALSRLNRCGLRFWFADILGLADGAESAEDRLGAEVRLALRAWSETGEPGDEAGLRSLLEARVVPAVRPMLPTPALLEPLRARLALIAAVVCRKAALPIGEPIATGVGVTGDLFGVSIDLTIDVLLGHPGGLELLLWQVTDGLVDRLAGEIDLSLAANKITELFPQHEIAAGSVVDVMTGTVVPLSLASDTTKRILLEGATRLATGDLQPRRSAECARCPYRILCPAHPEGSASW